MPKLSVPINYRTLTGYSFLVAVAYQFGYWRPFGIPIFEYASFSDVLRFAIWPVVAVIGSVAIWPWLTQLGGGDKPLSETARRRWLIAIFVAVAAGALITTYFDSPASYELTGILFGVVCWQAARRYITLSDVPSELRPALLFLLASMPMWAWGVGGMVAHQILNGQHFNRVTVPHSVVLRVGIDDDDELRMLGRTDAYVLLWMPTRSRALIIADHAVDAMQIETRP